MGIDEFLFYVQYKGTFKPNHISEGRWRGMLAWLETYLKER